MDIDVSLTEIVSRYVKNPITKALVFGGLEPFDSMIDLFAIIIELRNYTNDDIVIYTGYTEQEIERYISKLKQYKNYHS